NSVGVSGVSTNSTGMLGTSHGSGSAVAAVQGNNDSTTTAIRANRFGGNLFIGNNSSSVDVFRVDDSGDIFASHQVSVGLDNATSFVLEADGLTEAVVGIALSNNGVGIASTGVSGAAMYVATNSSD